MLNDFLYTENSQGFAVIVPRYRVKNKMFRCSYFILFRKETNVFQISHAVSKPVDDHVNDEEDDVAIPKRRWGEKFINGVEQSLDEEFGEMCDESVASLNESDASQKSISEELDKSVSLADNSTCSKKNITGDQLDAPADSLLPR